MDNQIEGRESFQNVYLSWSINWSIEKRLYLNTTRLIESNDQKKAGKLKHGLTFFIQWIQIYWNLG